MEHNGDIDISKTSIQSDDLSPFGAVGSYLGLLCAVMGSWGQSDAVGCSCY